MLAQPRAVVVLLLGAWALLAAWHALNASCTMDEAGHLYAGLARWHGDPNWNIEHPPLAKSLSGLPLRLAGVPLPPDEKHGGTSSHIAVLGAQLVFMQADWSWFTVLALGRLPMLLLLLLMGGLVAWGGEGRARWGGAVALAACVLDPTLTAHGTFIHTDGAAAAGVVAVMVMLERALDSGRIRDDAVLGFALGLAWLTKYSTLLLLPALLVVLPWRSLAARGPGALLQRLAIVASAAWVTMFAWFGTEPVQAVMRGVTARGYGGYHAYLLGQTTTEFAPAYYPVAFLAKTPIGHLLLLVIAVLATRAGGPHPDVRRWIVVATVYAAGFVATGIQLGWRHMLPPTVLIYMAAGVVLARAGRARWFRGAAVALVLSAASVLARGPSWTGYFNELAGGPRGGARLLSDSNLDWGQDLVLLRSWMDEQRVPMVILAAAGNTPAAALGIRFQLMPSFGHAVPDPVEVLPPDIPRELLVVSAMELQGVYANPPQFEWLHGREPVTIIGSSLWVFDITGDEDAHAQVTAVYRRAGWGELHNRWILREAARTAAR